MSFTSAAFLIFLPLVFALYWLTRRHLRMQNSVLLAASYIFYGWWDWRFLILIIITSLSSFASGLFIAGSAKDNGTENVNLNGNSNVWLNGNGNRNGLCRLVAAANIMLNIGILAVFKYYNFFADNFACMLSSVGMSVDFPTLNIILPVGISFYTFQSLSYTIDVYRKKIAATTDLVAFCTFIAFFPQLVAGPIERATNLLPQMQGRRTFSYPAAVDGCRQMLWGFFKKMVIADNCALAVDSIWQDYSSMNGTTMVVGAILFTFQIYCDFSGYSDIAIGTARLFGINLMQNFRMPYFSRNIAEFWRRWHISLMTWFRDYVYIPLGGSRCGRHTTLRNTIIVFALSGLWHGANWTYVCWGLYHALLFLPIILVSKSRKYADEPQLCLGDVCKMLLTFLLVAVGWIVFRAPSVSQAVGYIAHTAANMTDSPLTIMHGKAALLYSAVVVAAEWMQRRQPHALHFTGRMGAAGAKMTIVRYVVYLAIATAIILLRGEAQTFIYFQF